MIIAFLFVNGLLFWFHLSTHQWKKRIVYSHIQEMETHRLTRFFQSFQRLHFPWNLGSGLFFPNEVSLSHIPFRNIWLWNLSCRILCSVNHYPPSGVAILAKTSQMLWKKSKQAKNLRSTDPSVENVGNGQTSLNLPSRQNLFISFLWGLSFITRKWGCLFSALLAGCWCWRPTQIFAIGLKDLIQFYQY